MRMCITRPTVASISGHLRCFAHQNSGAHPNSDAPVKDRYPPTMLNHSDPRRKLALLVDAQKVDADVFCKTIEPATLEIGVPVLVRVFDYEISREWGNLIRHSSGDSSSSPSMRAAGSPPVEWFRVERFIPIGMQMLADADHICDHKFFNRIEGVCFICTELDRVYFERMLERLRGRGFNQYILDELGLVVEDLCDGRSKDGSLRM
jgi:hypothetical protein